MDIIYLTSAEERLFSSLSPSVSEAWEITHEEEKFQDTPERRFARLDLMRLQSDSPLRETFDGMRADTDERSIVTIASGIDPQSISDDDFREAFFTLGPIGMTVLIGKALSLVQTHDDLEGVAALSQIRHELLASLSSQP